MDLLPNFNELVEGEQVIWYAGRKLIEGYCVIVEYKLVPDGTA